MTIGASGGVGTLLLESLKGAATDLRGTVLQGCGHYLPEECPAAFADAVTGFWAASATARPDVPCLVLLTLRVGCCRHRRRSMPGLVGC